MKPDYPDADEQYVIEPVKARPVARKLTLPVSGARIGSVARPVAEVPLTKLPTRRFGLRVHTSNLTRDEDPE